MYVCISGDKNCSFFGKFGVFCFLETPVLRFVLLPCYRGYILSFFHHSFSVATQNSHKKRPQRNFCGIFDIEITNDHQPSLKHIFEYVRNKGLKTDVNRSVKKAFS